MQQQPSPTLDAGSKFAAPPSMVTGIQPAHFVAKSFSAEDVLAAGSTRYSR